MFLMYYLTYSRNLFPQKPNLKKYYHNPMSHFSAFLLLLLWWSMLTYRFGANKRANKEKCDSLCTTNHCHYTINKSSTSNGSLHEISYEFGTDTQIANAIRKAFDRFTPINCCTLCYPSNSVCRFGLTWHPAEIPKTWRRIVLEK